MVWFITDGEIAYGFASYLADAFGIDEDNVDGKKTAVLTCRKCDYKDVITDQNSMVYEHILKEDRTARLVLNPNLKNDPTLNHLSNIKCPNERCPANLKLKDPDVVPVKINEKDLIWLYQCVNCEATWKQASRVM
jgi:DNA-directed RNA polymerase subunit M/transcription elongation factor TFIIS